MDVLNIGGVLRAIEYAARMHHGQTRKTRSGISIPYVTHCITVARWAYEYGGVRDEEDLQVAILHDVVEDTEATYEDLVTKFSRRVADPVMELTLPDHLCKDQLTTTEREEKVLHQIAVMKKCPLIVGLTKVCDKKYNVKTLVSEPPAWTPEAIAGYARDSTRVVLAGRENPSLVGHPGFRNLLYRYLGTLKVVESFYNFKVLEDLRS